MLYLSYVFFFFKQKTAYEMRISDWSSDVCSSDLRLHLLGDRDAMPRPDESREIGFGRMDGNAAHRHRRPAMLAARRQRDVERRCGRLCIVEEQLEERAAESRVGKEWGRTCRTRWSLYSLKKNSINT